MVTTSSVVRLTGAPKHFAKSNLHQKMYLVLCCLSDPLQLSESHWNQYIWEVCSANRRDTLKTATPAASNGQQKGPDSSARQHLAAHHMTDTLEVKRIGLQKALPHPPYSPDLSRTYYHFFKHLNNFLRGKAPIISRKQKMLSKSSSNPKARIFTL